eukprot:3374524-Amphidinium_carterae.1
MGSVPHHCPWELRHNDAAQTNARAYFSGPQPSMHSPRTGESCVCPYIGNMWLYPLPWQPREQGSH